VSTSDVPINVLEKERNLFKYITIVFTREYTKYTAGYTFCFVVVAVGMDPLIKLGTNMIQHDQTFD
jgi:hypothetical protein